MGLGGTSSLWIRDLPICLGILKPNDLIDPYVSQFVNVICNKSLTSLIIFVSIPEASSFEFELKVNLTYLTKLLLFFCK